MCFVYNIFDSIKERCVYYKKKPDPRMRNEYASAAMDDIMEPGILYNGKIKETI